MLHCKGDILENPSKLINLTPFDGNLRGYCYKLATTQLFRGSSQLLQSTCDGSLESSAGPNRRSAYCQCLQEPLRLDEEWGTIKQMLLRQTSTNTSKYKYHPSKI